MAIDTTRVQTIEEIEPFEAAEEINGGDVVLIDTREPHEYQEAHLENGKLVPPGLLADEIGTGTAASQAAKFLTQIEPVLPGIGAYYAGRATVDCWRKDAFTRGSYSYWQVGQYTKFAGIEGAQEGNAHFCGEHTSIDAQGYLEGAVETGERAADEVIGDLGV